MGIFKTNLSCNYKLTSGNIDKYIPKNKNGAYALGKLAVENGELILSIYYIGSSYECLNRRLKDHIYEGEETDDKKPEYLYFQYIIHDTDKKAFDHECYLYHLIEDDPRVYNKNHPKKPKGTSYKCLVDGCEYI